MSYYYKIQKTTDTNFHNPGGKHLNAEDALSIGCEFVEKYKIAARQNHAEEPDVFALTFYDENDHSITIIPGGEGCFNVVYENKTQYADLMLSDNINENPENISPVDYLIWFFNNELETKLSPEAFIEKPNDSQGVKILSFGPRNKSFYECLLPTAYFLFFSFIILSFFIIDELDVKTAFVPLLIAIFLFSISIPSFVLWFNYSRVNRRATFHYRKKDHQYLYCDRKRQIEFNAKDIKSAVHIHVERFTHSIKKVWASFEYLEINLKNEDPIYITCIMADISDILFSLDLKYKTRNESFPKIKSKQNQAG